MQNVEFLGDEKIVYATFSNGNEVSAIVLSDAHFDMFENIKISSTNNVLLFNQDGINVTANREDLINA